MSMRRLAAFVPLLLGTIAPVLAEPHRLVLPETIEWKINAQVEGKTLEFSLPRQRKAILALAKTDREPLLENVRRIERNQKLARRIGKSFFGQRGRSPSGALTPDYERTLGEVAVSISFTDAKADDPLYRNWPILKALPAYTKIHVVMPTATENAARKKLLAENLIQRSVLHPEVGWDKQKENMTEYSRATRWVRDTFLVGQARDRQAIVYKPLAYAYVSDLARSDLDFLQAKWHRPESVVPIPGFIRGGNVAVADNNAGRRIAFLGHDEINQNEAHYRHATGVAPPRDLLPEIVKRIAGVSNVEILANSTLLFHLDMAVSFLGPGVAALLAPIDESALKPDEITVLTELRKSLAKKGFRIVNIPTTVARINAYQSPVNILPFTDKTNGKRRAIVPLFPDLTVNLDGRAQSLNAAIKSAYEQAGVEVIFAEDRFSDRRGNVHCTIVGLT